MATGGIRIDTRGGKGACLPFLIPGRAVPIEESTKPSQRPVRRRKRSRRVREEYTIYLVRVEAWNYHFSFRATDPKSDWEGGPYSVLPLVSFEGVIIRPEGSSFRRAAITFSGRAGLMPEKTSGKLGSIGSLSAAGDELSAYIFVPLEQITELCTAAASARVQIISFTATRLRYRSALIRSLSLDTKFNEEEW